MITCESIENGLQFGDLFVTDAVNDEIIAAAYLKAKECGIADRVWWDGHSLRWYLNWSFGDCARNVACFKRIGEEVRLVGMAWFFDTEPIGDSGEYKAEMGFMFFPEHSVFDSQLLCKMALKYVADKYNILMLYGITPEQNKKAIGFIKRLGCRMFGPIPKYLSYQGYIDGAYISQIDKPLIDKLVEVKPDYMG